jgi:hypothetical protein
MRTWTISIQKIANDICYSLASVERGGSFQAKQLRRSNQMQPYLSLVLRPDDEINFTAAGPFEIQFATHTGSPLQDGQLRVIATQSLNAFVIKEKISSKAEGWYKYTLILGDLQDDPDFIVDPRRP